MKPWSSSWHQCSPPRTLATGNRISFNERCWPPTLWSAAPPLLLRVLDQPDSTVRVAAAFALGLLGDSSAVEPLIQRLTGLPPLDTATASEAVTALGKIGGRRSAEFFAAVLG